MAISLKGRNFFALEDFTPEEIRYLLDLAIQLKKESKEHIKHQDYIGEDFLLLFEMNSTRTRCAFETSANDLGMGTTFLSNSHFGNTDHQHPTQMLADAMTLDEVWGRENYKGKTLCFIGRGGAVNSFSYGVMCAMLGMNFTYITSYMEMDEALEGLTAAEKATFRKFVPEGVVSPNWDTKMEKNCSRNTARNVNLLKRMISTRSRAWM